MLVHTSYKCYNKNSNRIIKTAKTLYENALSKPENSEHKGYDTRYRAVREFENKRKHLMRRLDR